MQLTLLDEKSGWMAEVEPLKKTQLKVVEEALTFASAECGTVSIKVEDAAPRKVEETALSTEAQAK